MEQFKVNLQLFAEESAQEPSIPDELKGMDEQFVAEIMAENESLNAEPSVKGEGEVKPVEAEQESAQEPVKAEPDYKQMYENMQRALKEEREKNRQIQQPIQQPVQQQPEQPKIKTAREEAKERLVAKYGEFNQFDEEHVAELAETIADIQLERKFSAIQQHQQQTEYERFVQPYATRPDIQELLAFANAKLSTLPEHERIGIAYAEQTRNVAVLKPLYDRMVAEFEASKQVANNQTKKLEQMAAHPRASQVKGGAPGAVIDPMELADNWANLTKEQKRELERLTNKIT